MAPVVKNPSTGEKIRQIFISSYRNIMELVKKSLVGKALYTPPPLNEIIAGRPTVKTTGPVVAATSTQASPTVPQDQQPAQTPTTPQTQPTTGPGRR